MKIYRAWLLLAILATVGAGAAPGASPEKPKPKTEAAVDAKPEDPPGQIDGLEIARPGGGFLGLQVVENRFLLSFYDAKKKKLPPDVARATARWPVKYQPTDERTILNPGVDGTSLTSAKIVRPPHNFRVYLGLYASEGEEPVETYVVAYRS